MGRRIIYRGLGAGSERQIEERGIELWDAVLLVDGKIGLGGDPRRIMSRAAELLCRGGRCVAEFDAEAIGIHSRWARLESACDVGPWFRWASVGVDSAAVLAGQAGLTLTGVRLIGGAGDRGEPRCGQAPPALR